MERLVVTGMKTYSALMGALRKPSPYEVTTTGLLYAPPRSFAVNVPLGAWYERYQRGSALRCDDWDAVRDPRETTYATYTERQAKKQVFVDGLFRSAEQAPEALPAGWLEVLERVVSPMRFLAHGLQMVAAYVGQMAPSGRLVVLGALTAADELRVIDLVSARMAERGDALAGAAPPHDGRSVWEREPAWQPTRELVERMLTTYDWGEAFVALHRVAKPVLAELFFGRFARVAKERGDGLLAHLLLSLGEDAAWHREWSSHVVALAVAQRPENEAVIARWEGVWQPRADHAARALEPLIEAGGRHG